MHTVVALVAAIVSVLIGGWFTSHVWRALISGSANVHNVAISRRRRPAFFWSAVIVQSLFGLLWFANARRMAHALFGGRA